MSKIIFDNSSKAKDEEGLNANELAFVEGVSRGMTAKEAFVQAGYQPETATNRKNTGKLLRKPEIQAALARRRAEMRNKFQVTREDCVRGMLEAIKDAKILSDPTAQIAGWREIAKMLGHYEPERKVVELSSQRDEAIKQLQEMPMEELLALADDSNVIDGEFALVVNG